jgi:hypothetical protein
VGVLSMCSRQPIVKRATTCLGITLSSRGCLMSTTVFDSGGVNLRFNSSPSRPPNRPAKEARQKDMFYATYCERSVCDHRGIREENLRKMVSKTRNFFFLLISSSYDALKVVLSVIPL